MNIGDKVIKPGEAKGIVKATRKSEGVLVEVLVGRKNNSVFSWEDPAALTVVEEPKE
jgi:hypothetical protein